MGKIIAIGGGEIGRPGTKIETFLIDKEIIKQTGKKNPKLLFIPTASSESESYYAVVKKYFTDKHNCKVDVLYLLKEKYSEKELRDKILATDIVYVGGGNTKKMLSVWRKLGVDRILKEAYDKGIVLSGLSAGAICWFTYGNSDSLSFADKKASMIKVKGLGLVDALFCPHYDVEKKRKPELKKMMETTAGIALALENCTAIEIIDDTFRILSSKKGAKAYKTYWLKGKYVEEIIPVSKKFKELAHAHS